MFYFERFQADCEESKVGFLKMTKNFLAVVLVFAVLFFFADFACADDQEDLERWLREEYERTSNDMSYEDWLRYRSSTSEDWNQKFNPTSGDKKSGDKSGDKKVNNKLWAQEPSQIAIAILTFAEMKTLERIEEDQEKMLKKWNSTEIEKARSKILKNIENARDILAKSPAFNHYAKDIDAMMKARYPEWKAKMTIEEMAKRINERDSKWKESLKVYLKSMNATTSHFDDDLKMRDELMKILKKPDGQVQAIQAIGGYFDHMNMMMTRDELVLQSLMTVMIERKRDAYDERNDLGEAVKEAGTSIKSYNPKSKKKYKVGF